MNDALLYGWKQIAKFIGCSVTTAKRYHRRGMMPVDRVYGTPVGCREDIREWVKKRKAPAR